MLSSAASASRFARHNVPSRDTAGSRPTGMVRNRYTSFLALFQRCFNAKPLLEVASKWPSVFEMIPRTEFIATDTAMAAGGVRGDALSVRSGACSRSLGSRRADLRLPLLELARCDCGHARVFVAWDLHACRCWLFPWPAPGHTSAVVHKG